MVEPFINHFRKMNSNSGWRRSQDWLDDAMDALSHFRFSDFCFYVFFLVPLVLKRLQSYHASGGQMVLCDIQGGWQKMRSRVLLTDPVVLSRRQLFGPADLGTDGILSFFSNHVCSEYCQEHWAKPANPVRRFVMMPGTSMMNSTADHRSYDSDDDYLF